MATKAMLVTYQVQVRIEAPKGGDDEDTEYIENCNRVEAIIEGLPGYVSHDLEDESDA